MKPVSRARSSSRLRRGCGPVGALLDPLTIEYGPIDSVLVIGAMTATASTTAASTPAPPLATGPPHHSLLQPTLTRVALACIYTAHTSHSRHRLPLAARLFPLQRQCPS